MISFTAFIASAAGKICLFGLVMVLLIKGSQTVTLQPFKQSDTHSECINGVIDGVDKVVLYGTVDTGGATTPNEFYFQRKAAGASNFYPECTVRFVIDGCKDDWTIGPCYCQSNTNNVYTVVYNSTASLSKSLSELILYWDDASKGATVQMPVVYNAAHTTLKLGGRDADLDNCAFDLDSGDQYEFTFCENNLANPTLTITFGFNGSTVPSSGPACKSFSLAFVSSYGGSQLSLARRGSDADCPQNKTFTCSLNERDSSSDGLSTEAIVGIVIGVAAAVAIIIIIIVCSCCGCCGMGGCCGKKKS